MASNAKDRYFAEVTEICLDRYGQREPVSPHILLERLMDMDGLPMHCPVHHYMIPAVLLAACRQRQGHGGEVLARDLKEAEKRARNVLGGFCGFYGACGAAVGVGIFWSVITDCTPCTAGAPWAWANRGTGEALIAIADGGGPRCCKRVCFLTLASALPRIESVLGLRLDTPERVACRFHERNNECLREACAFYSAGASESAVAT